ncbi:MAG: hypothetical protein HY812_02705 [Planctomycetes bacterium]|nr:hypothetical protein [Planctomycetota bacterium]
MSLLSDDPRLLILARQVTAATGAPVVGGIAVFLHGYRRTTADIDLLAAAPRETAAVLEKLGATWDEQHREHVLDGVPIHLVTLDQAGGPPQEIVRIQGVAAVSLRDLVRQKLRTGLDRPDRAQDLADVVELIRHVPLDKRFASRLPKTLRVPFKKLVDAVRDAPRSE